MKFIRIAKVKLYINLYLIPLNEIWFNIIVYQNLFQTCQTNMVTIPSSFVTFTLMSMPSIPFSKPLIKNLNSTGPGTNPMGIQHVTFFQVEIKSSVITPWSWPRANPSIPIPPSNPHLSMLSCKWVFVRALWEVSSALSPVLPVYWPSNPIRKEIRYVWHDLFVMKLLWLFGVIASFS